MLRRILFLAMVVALAPGCTTIKGWFGSKQGKVNQPTELTKLASPISVKRLWSVNLGDGEDRRWLRQHPTIDGNRVYAVNDNGEVLAIDAVSGKAIWTANAIEVPSKH